MHVEEFSYPQITAARAILESFLKHCLPDYSIAIHDARYRVALCDEQHARMDAAVNLRCVLAAHPVIIQIETRGLEQCFPDGLSVDHFKQLPDDLQLAGLHIVFDDTFAELSQTLRDTCMLQKLEYEPPPAGQESITFTLSNDSSVIRGVMHLSSDAMAWFAELCQQHESEAPTINPPHDLPLLLRLELAQTSLLASQLHSLATDDIVLFPVNSGHDGQAVARVGDACFAAQLDEENGLSIHARLHSAGLQEEPAEGLGRTADDAQPQQADETNDGEELSFVVRFEFPAQKISLHDLHRLSLGKRVVIAPCSPSKIFACIGHRVIAHCELVAIQNRHGARILEVQQQQTSLSVTESEHA